MKANYEVRELELLHVITSRHKGDYSKISEAYERLANWAAPRGLMEGCYMMAAIYYNDPMVTPVDQLLSDACLVVNGEVAVDGEIGKTTIGGGKCLIGHFELTMDEYPAAWKRIAEYMAAHGFEYGDGVPFELYPDCSQDMNGDPNAVWKVDICMPVK